MDEQPRKYRVARGDLDANARMANTAFLDRATETRLSHWYVNVPRVAHVNTVVTFTSTLPLPGGALQVMMSGAVKRTSVARAAPKSTLNVLPESPSGARIVTRVPPAAGPEVGHTLPDAGKTVNSNGLLRLSETVTVTALFAAAAGTLVVMLASDQD